MTNMTNPEKNDHPEFTVNALLKTQIKQATEQLAYLDREQEEVDKRQDRLNQSRQQAILIRNRCADALEDLSGVVKAVMQAGAQMGVPADDDGVKGCSQSDDINRKYAMIQFRPQSAYESDGQAFYLIDVDEDTLGNYRNAQDQDIVTLKSEDNEKSICFRKADALYVLVRNGVPPTDNEVVYV